MTKTRSTTMKEKITKLASWLTLAAFVAARPAFADDAMMSMVKSMQDSMKEMQQIIRQQGEKIQKLESRPAVASVASIPSGTEGAAAPATMSEYDFNTMLDSSLAGSQKWLKNLKFSGDFRLRYEAFEYDSGSPSETDDRNRFRYRLRFGFEKKFSDQMDIGFGLASGENTGTNGLNVDPTSTNTTFDNNFNFKAINIEKAWARYQPDFLANRWVLKKTQIVAGKMNNLFEKGSSDMIWDRDVKPEGLQENMTFDFYDGENFDLAGFVTLGQFILDEDASRGGDANLFAYQFGINPVVYTPVMERPVDLTQAFSFYDFGDYAARSNFIIGGSSLARGNVNTDGLTTELDAGKFKILESYTEVAIYPMGLPVRAFADIAGNPSDAANGFNETGALKTLHRSKDTDMAYAFGGKLGGINKKGDWETSWTWKTIGANSVVGAFNDSDFGDGHAGKRGQVIKAGYAITDNLTLNSALFFVKNLNPGSSSIVDQNQNRFQVDMVWKF